MFGGNFEIPFALVITGMQEHMLNVEYSDAKSVYSLEQVCVRRILTSTNQRSVEVIKYLMITILTTTKTTS